MSGLVIWITGLPGSGKSTIAEGVKSSFPECVVLRMDELRKILTPQPTYSETERETVYRAIVYMAKTLSELGHHVIIDATGNLKRWRELARRFIPRYMEVYLKCSLKTCMEREALRLNSHGAPRDIYKKGLFGHPVPGLSAPYEEPDNPEVLIEIDNMSQEAAIAAVTKATARRTNQK
ncbi:MAG: adenylyl-sulfate kinase [Nitrospirae bacterium]|nr:MAG: adenylyl-sulfate kinase [Nitrospirota bacterium]